MVDYADVVRYNDVTLSENLRHNISRIEMHPESKHTIFIKLVLLVE